MINKILKFKNFYKLSIFIPLIFYFGKRSYIAFDEGFYALQARWILDKDNWIIPLWWDQYVLDRTIGLQFLIAKSQEIFGRNMFAAYIPTTTAAILMLFITYKFHEEFFDKKYAIISPLILSTTYLWFDYSHLATQDIIYSCLVSIGVFSLIKIKNKDNKFYILLFGIWIGLSFMMKTFLVIVPLVSLVPYLFIKKNIFFSKFFWLGLLIGFVPFIYWALSINPYLEKNIIFYLIEKFKNLSNENTFTNPFYYYFWNIPAIFQPWSFFSIIGTIYNIFKNKEEEKYVLTFFPLVLVGILSFFSSKTPYYTLQISSIFALNAFVGIEYLFSSKKYKLIFIFITSKIIPIFIVALTCIYYFFFKNITNFNFKENVFLVLGLLFFALSWSCIKNKNSFKRTLITLIIGPYLLTSFLLQSGLFTDRSRELRETMEYVSSIDIAQNQPIKVDKSGINSQSQSKIIRISLLTPKLGESIDSLDQLKKSELAWSTKFKKIPNKNYSYEVIYENDILKPWRLILKK